MKHGLTHVSSLQNSAMTDLNPEMNQPTVLLTGFDAFGGDAINPSWLAVQELSGAVIEGHAVVAAQLPTEFAASTAVLHKLLRKHRPALVLCVGLAGGRSALSLERIAINVQDARIPDNAGTQPIDIPILRSGPAAYFSTLPIKATLQALTAAGIDADVSQTAGTFVCNHVFYLLMHSLKKQHKTAIARGGFIHLPYLPGQGLPCMPLEEMARGLRVALTCAINTPCDALVGAGSLN
jgi:pyroglutamyl-peptidase